jgi:hypothetical protein
VSSADQRADLDRQVARLAALAAERGLRVAKVVAEVGSGLNGHRKGLLTALRAPEYGVLIVEHRDRLAGFGSESIEPGALADAALAELHRQLAYKTVWYGSRLVEADLFYPSSQRGSRCGAVKAVLPLEERTYRGDVCGLVLDRDENAALAVAVAGSGPETKNACGREVRPATERAVPEEAGSWREMTPEDQHLRPATDGCRE